MYTHWYKSSAPADTKGLALFKLSGRTRFHKKCILSYSCRTNVAFEKKAYSKAGKRISIVSSLCQMKQRLERNANLSSRPTFEIMSRASVTRYSIYHFLIQFVFVQLSFLLLNVFPKLSSLITSLMMNNKAKKMLNLQVCHYEYKCKCV